MVAVGGDFSTQPGHEAADGGIMILSTSPHPLLFRLALFALKARDPIELPLDVITLAMRHRAPMRA